MRKRNHLIIIIALIIFSTHHVVYGQDIATVDENELIKMIKDSNHDILIINFWASWCKPCIKEMPWMDTFKYKNKTTKVIFVSLDEGKFLKKSLPKVLKKLNLQSPVYRLLFKNYHELESVVKKINKNWDGVLPATLVTDTKSKKNIFLEGKLIEEKLVEKIDKI